MAVTGLSAVLLSLAGIPWSLVTFLLALVGIVVITLLVKHFVFRLSWFRLPRHVDWRTTLGATAGLLAGGVASALNLILIFGSPSNLAQRYDNVYHLNAVRWVLEQGDASTLTLGRILNPTADIAVYPAAWHGFAALIVDVTNQPIPVAVNALNIVIASLVWPVGVMLLARIVFGAQAVLIALTGVFSAGFTAFPIGLIDFGPLYPNLLSYAVLPAALALAILMLKVRPRDDNTYGVILLAFLTAIIALMFAQPNGFTALLALSLPVAIFSWFRWVRAGLSRRGGRGILLPLLIAALFVTGFIVTWRALLIGYDTWQPFTRYASAIGQAITSAPHERGVPVVIAVCTAVGLIRLIRDGGYGWLLGLYGVVVALYAVSAAEPRGALRYVVVGSWYQDPQRLASLLPLPTVLIAAFGASGILLWLWARLLSVSSAPSRGLKVAAGTVVALVAVLGGLGSQRGPIDEMVAESRQNHTWEGNPTILSLDELALLERLDDEVPEDAVIAVNPWNGGALAYAISGRAVTQYHMSSRPLPPDLSVLAQNLDDARYRSEACAIAREERVEYVLDFGDFYLLDLPEAENYPAFDDIDDPSALELVDEEGDARLYRVASCFDPERGSI
ncbi:hypothetical protein E8P82_09935 [Arthrobacter echini]|uniref:Arabinofuranosyltransferase AftA N-terminal domain-containing protein n=1 Tax=Arthrobacter echini TaxID=1529066 RepID=A0A4S5E3H7_9MICC|nr:DUF6541 family protein [Arthrobacter echini]THJ65957.1 hypothetical protein E8P82_09935 [Arthrobacter echini]